MLHYVRYTKCMSARMGRPPTGRTPNTSIRLDPTAHHLARIAAVTEHKTLGQWLAEAIREKVERDKEAQDVITSTS